MLVYIRALIKHRLVISFRGHITPVYSEDVPNTSGHQDNIVPCSVGKCKSECLSSWQGTSRKC